MTTPGEVIKQLREARKITQEQLARALDVALSTVVKWEANDNDPDTPSIVKLARYFNLPERIFMRGTKENELSEQDVMIERLRQSEYWPRILEYMMGVLKSIDDETRRQGRTLTPRRRTRPRPLTPGSDIREDKR